MSEDQAQRLRLHALQFHIAVSTVSIQIKFPCKLSLAARIGKEQTASSEEVKLEAGRATFEQPMTLRCNLTYNPLQKKYAEKKSMISVYILSATGKNIAGVCSFDAATVINQGTTSENFERIPLERCPDRTALISFKIRATFIQEVIGQSSEGNSFTGGFAEESRPDFSAISPRVEYHQTRSNAPVRNLINGRSERRFQIPKPPEREGSANSQNLAEETLNRSRFSGTKLQLAANKRREESDLTLQLSTLKTELTEHERKLTRLELEKQNYIREITQLKAQVESSRMERMTKNSREVELQDDNERLRRKLESMEVNVEALKKAKQDIEKSLSEKIQSSRNERSLADELTMKAVRIEELETDFKNAKRAKDDLDKVLKEKVRELKDSSEKIEDLQNSVATLQKRFDMKDSFYKDEVKKYNDKFMEAEHERLRLTTELSSLKEGGEDGFKKLQQSLKDKEKAWSEERLKLTRRNDQLKKELDQAESSRQQERAELQQHIAIVDKLNKSVAANEYDKISIMEEVERLKNQLISEGLYKGRYEECLKEKNQLAQQKIALEKELQEERKDKTTSLGTLSKQHNDANTQARSLGQQLSDCQKKLKERELKLNELQQECESIRKKCDNFKRADEKKAQEIEERKAVEKAQASEIKELNETISELEGLLSQNRERADNDIDSLRRTLKKTTEENEQNKFKLVAANETIDQLREELQASRDRQASLTDKNAKHEEKLRKFKVDVDTRDSNARQLTDEISSVRKSADETKVQLNQMRLQKEDLQTRLADSNEQLHSLREALESTQSSSSEQVLRLQRQAKEKDAEINRRGEELTRLEILISQNETQLNTVREELRARTAELAKERTSGEIVRRELAQLTDDYAEIEELLKVRGDELFELKRESGQTSTDKSKVEDQLATIRSEYEKYRKGNQQGMRALLEEISKQSFNVDRLLESLLDYETSSVQVEVLKAVRALTEHHNTVVKGLNDQVEVVSRELSIEKARASQRELQLENSLAAKEEEYEYVKKAMQLDKENLEEYLDSQTHRLEQAEADTQLVTSERDRFESMYKRTLLEKEEAIAQLDTTTTALDNTKIELVTLNEELKLEKRMREDTKTRLEGECSETERKLQMTEKELRNQVARLEEQLKLQTNKTDEVLLQLKSARTELENRAAIIRENEERIGRIENELTEKGLDVSSGYKREKDLSDRNRQLESLLLAEEEQVARKTANIGELQNKLRELEEARKILEKDKSVLTRRLEQSDEDIEGKDLTIANQSQQIDELREQHESLLARLAQLESSKSMASEESVSKTRQLQQQNKHLDQLKERHVKLEREITQKSDEILLLKDANDREQKRLNAQLEQLRTTLQLTENSLRKEQQASERRQRQTDELILEQQRIREQLENDITQLNEEIYVHSSDVNTLRIKEEEDSDTIKQLEQEVARLKESVADNQRQLEEKEYFINVDVAAREREYYDLKKKMEQKIAGLDRQLEQSKEELVHTKLLHEEREQQRDAEAKQLQEELRILEAEKHSSEEKGSLQVEELEFKRQSLEMELESVKGKAAKAEQQYSERIAELEFEIETLRNESKDKEQNLSGQAQTRMEEIKRLNAEMSNLQLEKDEVEYALAREKQQNEERQMLHQSEMARVQTRLEESLKQSRLTADEQLKSERAASEQALNEAQKEYEESSDRLRNEIAELQQNLHMRTEEKNLLRSELLTTEQKLSTALDDLRHAEGSIQQLTAKLAETENLLLDTQNSYEGNLSERNQEYNSLMKTHEITQKTLQLTQNKLEETAANYKQLNETKVCYNPAHCYLPQILNNVKLYQGEKNELLQRVSQLENALRRETQRIRALQAQNNAFTEEKTRVLNRLRELSVTVLKSKTKALARTRNQAESKLVVDEYKIFQDNIRELLGFSTNLFQTEVAEISPEVSQHSMTTAKPTRLERVASKEESVRSEDPRQPIRRTTRG